jgi:hypothetical protein
MCARPTREGVVLSRRSVLLPWPLSECRTPIRSRSWSRSPSETTPKPSTLGAVALTSLVSDAAVGPPTSVLFKSRCVPCYARTPACCQKRRAR